MPTESAFLLAGLLFIAAALGYVFARYGEEDDESGVEQLNSDYVKGLNFVLNEEPDRAVEVFTRMAELDDEALETHFALGGLFRKRGEVDRAIRVHENLIARASLTKEQRYQAEVALAEDYLSAGLFDRAESMFTHLADSRDFRLQAMRQLRRIYEITRDWERAVEISKELAKRETRVDQEGPPRLAHYYCELAEEAWQASDEKQSRKYLKLAEAGRSKTIRSTIARADIDHACGRYVDSITGYRSVIEAEPDLLVEMLPRVAASCRSAGAENEFSAYIKDLVASDPINTVSIASAVVREPAIENPLAIAELERFVISDSTLSRLVNTEALEQADTETKNRMLQQVREALRSIVMTRPAYFCKQCGYACLTMQWQCPGCHSWETVRPVVGISLVARA